MVRSELIEKLVSENPRLTQADLTKALDAIFGEIITAVGRGKRVELRGFGAFQAKQRQNRLGRNPKTGDEVHVEAKQVVAFKASKLLLARINRGL